MYNIRNVSNINYDTAFGLFDQLNTDELKELLNDDSKLDEIIKDDKQCKDIEKEKEILLVSNRSLAEFNLTKEPIMTLLKKQLIELNENCESFYNKIDDNSIGNSGSLDLKLSMLQTATSELEEETEKIADNFLNSEMDLDDFLEQFISRRKIMHLYKVKSDKMSEIISQQSEINSPNFMQQKNYNGGMRYGY